MMKKTAIVIGLICAFNLYLCAQITPEDGDWAERYVVLQNTPQAELMVRTGDIDNLGFGWPANFDPFSGNNTPSHAFPWTPDTTDVPGLDRVLVISSYNGSPPSGRDGYTSSTSRPANSVAPVTIGWPAGSVAQIDSAILQIFVDDFQAPVWGADYQVRFDGVRVPVMESVINSLVQTGPIGRIVNLQFPPNLIYLLADDSLTVLIDDSTTGAGDGFALDFLKLLVNPISIAQTGTINGTIKDAVTQELLSGVRITANGLVSDTTDSSGTYSLQGVLAGLVTLQTYRSGYGSSSATTNLAAGQGRTVNFQLQSPAPQIVQVSPEAGAEMVDPSAEITVLFNTTMDTTSINSNSLILTGGQSTVSGGFQFSGNQVVFTPQSTLQANTEYSATLTTDVVDMNGISIEQAYSWSFTTGQPTGISDAGRLPINSFELFQNYPNPFNPATQIRFFLSGSSLVSLEIYSIDGKLIETLIQPGIMTAGEHSVKWNAENAAGGVYFYRVKVDGFTSTKKMLLIR